MQNLALLVLFAACGSSSSRPPGLDVDAATAGPVTLAQFEHAVFRVAVIGDCVLVTGWSSLSCVSRLGGAPQQRALLQGRRFIEAVGDGDDVIATSVRDDFGPDGDQTLQVHRIAGDGTVAELASVGAGYGAGEGLAIAGDRVVFSTGGRADLLAMPKHGGTRVLLASDSGNFGDVAVTATDAYYVNGFSIYRQSLTGPRDQPVSASALAGQTVTLASDGATVFAIGEHFTEPRTELVVIGGPLVAPIAGLPERSAAHGGHGYLIVAGDVHELDLVTGTTRLVAGGEQAIDVAATADGLYWITKSHALRMQRR
jgi:hypothetical protein